MVLHLDVFMSEDAIVSGESVKLDVHVAEVLHNVGLFTADVLILGYSLPEVTLNCVVFDFNRLSEISRLNEFVARVVCHKLLIIKLLV